MKHTLLEAFIASEIEPNAARWERERHVPPEVFSKAGAAGLCGLMVPTEDSGAGATLLELTGVFERLAYSDMGFAFALIPHNNLSNAIAREGSNELKSKYLPAMLAGESLGAFLLTEPGVGTDASRISTTASLNNGRWVINGDKSWVTNGSRADVLRVYAQTEPGSGAKGIAAFLVDANQQGVAPQERYEMLGGHATGACAIHLNNVEVQPVQLFTPPGIAFRAAMDAIGLARVLVAALCNGILKRALDVATERLKSRQAFGQRLADNQGLRWMLADVATDIQASVALTEIAAQAIDVQAADEIVRAAHAKKFAARAASRGIEACMQVLGADGLLHDHPLARQHAGAKMAHYLDGSTEVQNLLISKSLLD